MTTRSANISNILCGSDQPLILIAGPCVIESHELATSIAQRLREICGEHDVPLIFKASFDKANRTSVNSYRGVGIDKGLTILGDIKQRFDIPVTTDIHQPQQAGPAGQVCDVLQIPAFLARQTDLLVAAAKTGRPVNVKKGQFMSPGDMRFVVEKLRHCGCENIMLTERGTFFGYGKLVNDFAGLVQMREFGVPVIFDATHSVQQSGCGDGRTGGNREMVAPLARAAVAVGVDGLFIETHPEPDTSPSDAANILPLDHVSELLATLKAIRQATVSTNLQKSFGTAE